VDLDPLDGYRAGVCDGTIGGHRSRPRGGSDMSKGETTRLQPLKRLREKRAVKAARSGDTPEKLAERRKPSDHQSPKDVADKASLGGFLGGF
jgi:hypothetical protein